MKRIRSMIEVLSQDEIVAIHKSSLRILESTGFKVPDDECLGLCEKAGAKVDRSNSTVRVPHQVMEEILAFCRKDNSTRIDVNDGTVSKMQGGVSTQVFIMDYGAVSRRYGTVDDVMKGLALIEHLDNIPHSHAVVIPSDAGHDMSDVVSHQLIYSYGKKPGGTYILTPTSAKYIIAMSKAVGRNVGYLLETVSPLQFRKESLEMALIFAKAGQQLYMGPMVIAGASGPVTLAGTVTLQNTEVLASMFMIYVLTGAASGYGAGTHTMDMKTTLCSFGSPNQALIGICTAQMGKFYGLRNGNNIALTDALLPDFQGGFEKAASGILGFFAGNTYMGCQGIVGADQCISLEQLAIDNEWIDAFNYIIKGVEVNEKTIAADLIEHVGIAGNFMAEEHTVEYLKDNYLPAKLFNRKPLDGWISDGAKDLYTRAHEYVEDVTAGYKKASPVISSSLYDELEYMVKCAREEFQKLKD